MADDAELGCVIRRDQCTQPILAPSRYGGQVETLAPQDEVFETRGPSS
jgi:hypothetical protein